MCEIAILQGREGGLSQGGDVGVAAEIEPRELELDPDQLGCEDTQALLEQLLPRLVPLEDDDCPLVAHRAPV